MTTRNLRVKLLKKRTFFELESIEGKLRNHQALSADEITFVMGLVNKSDFRQDPHLTLMITELENRMHHGEPLLDIQVAILIAIAQKEQLLVNRDLVDSESSESSNSPPR